VRNPNKETAQFERPVTVFNASDEPFRAMFNAHPFDIPANGTLDVYDVWGIPSAQKDGKVVPSGPPKVFAHAREVVDHILRKHTERGIVEITGIPEVDAKRKAAALKAWTKRKLAQVNTIIAARSQYLRAFHADPANKGNYPNPPSESEQAAYEWREEYEEGLKGAQKRFKCVHDGFQTDDEAKWERHQRVSHAADAEAAHADEAPTKRRGRRSLAEAAEAVTAS